MEEDGLLNMEMRPQNVWGKSSKHPFGNHIPRNYFCHLELELDPRIQYDVAIKKFFYSWETYHELIDMKIQAINGTDTLLQDSYLWKTNMKKMFELNDMITLGLHRDDYRDESRIDKSKVVAQIKNAHQIHLYARNLESTKKGTFSISIRKTPSINQFTLRIIHTVLMIFGIGLALLLSQFLVRWIIRKVRSRNNPVDAIEIELQRRNQRRASFQAGFQGMDIENYQ